METLIQLRTHIGFTIIIFLKETMFFFPPFLCILLFLSSGPCEYCLILILYAMKKMLQMETSALNCKPRKEATTGCIIVFEPLVSWFPC